MRILYAASEVTGFAKTGGLADVAGLPWSRAPKRNAATTVRSSCLCTMRSETAQHR